MGMDESDQSDARHRWWFRDLDGCRGRWRARAEKVKLDAANQILFIGDDGYRYQLEGQQLTLKEADQDLGDQDTIVLTKNKLVRVGRKNPTPLNCLWIVEQDAVVEWALLRWFHQLLQPYSTVRRWDDEIEF